VACIGSGKTVNVSSGTNQAGVVQGEGTVRISGGSLQLITLPAEAVSSLATLKMTGGTLSGPGTLNITSSLTWTGASTMASVGATVVKSGATAELNLFGELKISERTFANEGTLTFSNGRIAASNGATIENSGIFKANSQWGTPEIQAGEGKAPQIVNTGTFEKSTGKAEGSGKTTIAVNFKNQGTVESKKVSLAFSGGGSSSGGAKWIGAEGNPITFVAGSYSLVESEVKGTAVVEGASVSSESTSWSSAQASLKSGTLAIASGSAAVETLKMTGGTLSGAGTLNITGSLTWTGVSTMAGVGATVVKSGATAELNLFGELKISERTFVNEGILTFVNGRIAASNGAKIENSGTFKANSQWGTPEISNGGGAAPQIINTGTFEKNAGSVSEWAGKTTIAVNFKNQGTVETKKTSLVFSGGGSSTGGAKWIAASGTTLAFTAGLFSMGANTWSGALEFKGATMETQGLHDPGHKLSISSGSLVIGSGYLEAGTLDLAGGTVILSESGSSSTASAVELRGGTLAGAGDLSVTSSLKWIGEKESLMAGTGKTVIGPGASAEFSVWGFLNLTERTLVNEGAATFSNGAFKVSNKARIKNLGTFKANSQWQEPEFRLASKADPSPLFVNQGEFVKTAGSGKTVVEMNLENHGTVKEQSGQLSIKNPVTVAKTEEFGKRSKCADPVDCATGNFYESQTDLAIGGLGVGLYLTRTYSAQAAAVATSPGIFGYGWTSSFGDRLAVEEAGAKVTLTQSDGSTIPFTKVGGTTYAAPAWSEDELSGSPEAGYTLLRADQIQLDFSGTGRLEGVVDRSGNETALAYDEAGRLKTIEDPAGRQITLTYNAGGQVESAEDPMGHVVKYAYESKHLKSVTLPGKESARWQFKYDGSHRMTEMVDGRGGKTTNEYDGSSRVKSQTDPAGRTITFEYASFHTKVTNKATGAVTDQWFTSNNQPNSITRGFGTADATTETFSYNEAGQLVTATDGNGHKTIYGYDAEGNLKSEKDAEGNETKWAYNGTHDVISMTTPEGETTTIERDGDGQVESISRPGPEETTQTTTFEHDELGQLESITDPLERTTTFEYNEQGDRIASADPEGNTRSFEYDESSRLEAIISPRGNAEGAEVAEYTITIERDQQGRPLKVIDPLGHASEYAYDANGNLEKRTNANGHTTKYTYNADNERTKVEKPNGAILETGYDGAGNVTSQTDGNKKTTTYVRNALGQPVEVVDPLSRKTIEEFDDAGNLKAMNDPAERKTSYAYDKADRLIGIDYSSEARPDVDLEYDANGNVTSMVDGTGESTFDYDELGRLTGSKNGNGDVVGYGYNLGEQLTDILYPNGKSISRTFDEAGRLETVTDWLGGTTSFGYDADSNLEEITFPAGTGNVDKYEYDPTGRMTDATFSKGMETLASLSYVRDKIGQVEDETSSGLPGAEEISYGYDKNERLIEAGEASFEYDAADNLTKAPGTTNAYDAASQLETGTAVSYTYDKLGQRIETAPGSGPATSYDYDQAGNLISIERPEEGEVPAIEQTLAYDGSGLLASKASGLATQYLTWDLTAPQPLLLDDDQNSYVYGPSGLPITQISSEETPTYLHHDQLGSTRMLTDSSGEMVGTSSFSSYGTLEGSTGTATTPMGFAGQYTDPESGLQYLRARFYDPATAQFMTKDPLAAVLRTAYGYASQSPLHYLDPSGMACVGVGHSGPVSFPTFDPGDCIDDAVDGAGDAAGSALNFGADNISLLAAPLVFLYCVYDPDGCTKAALFGAAGTAGVNGYREFKEPCFDFWSATLQDLLVTLAAALPGGIFEATAGRAGPQLGPIVRRIIQVVLDAPGLGLELVNGARGH
jgi:RHS repeat-associated protein